MSIAAVFPGQGSQAVGMARDFYNHSTAAKRVLDEAEAALPGLLHIMWEGPLETLTLTENQQPALVAASAAAFAAYVEAGGMLPLFAAGHSLGEYSAYVAAGSLTVAEAVNIVRKRGEYMQDAVPAGHGAMAAVMRADVNAIADVLAAVSTEADPVEIANYNSPQQTVISGTATGVARATEQLTEARARVVPLPVSAPFHSSLMEPAAKRLATHLQAVTWSVPRFTIINNVTAEPLAHVSDSPRLLTEQVTGSVRWTETVHTLARLGVTTLIEFGSGKVLTGLTGRINRELSAAPVTDMASLQEVLVNG